MKRFNFIHQSLERNFTYYAVIGSERLAVKIAHFNRSSFMCIMVIVNQTTSALFDEFDFSELAGKRLNKH